MRISDWSSDVCSSDLLGSLAVARTAATTPTPPITESHTSMNPDDYCQRKAAQSGSSFYYSFLFLPPERRQAITARSEERRVGKAWVRTCRDRWCPIP